ncbi:MAG TPA: hypothetical protein VGK84_11560 [Candidatus Tumulicola sp.]|jgi:hypothetical protein
MLSPEHRFPTLVLAIGTLVLLIAIAVGQRMGDRVLDQAAGANSQNSVASVTPEPTQSAGSYGPDWKRSETLAGASDPRFPDPRVPPQPLPTPLPTPKATPTPVASPTPSETYNPNIPIWRQKPLPTATPSAETSAEPATSSSPGEHSESRVTPSPSR